MEAGHGKGPCDPIAGVAKRKADQTVKNGKYVIQGAIDFFEWAKQDISGIPFSYVSVEDYEISEKFLKAACENVQIVKGTIKVHAVFSLKANSTWVRDIPCFCKNCFGLKFQKDSCCKGWRECLLTTSTVNQRKDALEKTLTKIKSHQELSLKIRNQQVLFPLESSDYVAAIYSGEPYVGQVEEIDGEGEEAHINFLEHKGDLQRRSKFNKPKKDKIWIPLSDIICIVPESAATKRAFEICPEVLDNVLEKFRYM